MTRSYIFTVALSLLFWGCDTQTEDSAKEISISLYAYTQIEDASHEDVDTPFGVISLTEEQALPISTFPHQEFRIPIQGLHYEWHTDELAKEVSASLYALVSAPEISMMQLDNLATITPPRSAKYAGADSLDLNFYFFLIEQPNITYPESIYLSYSVHTQQSTVELIPAQHRIPFEDQLLTQGKAFQPLPKEKGLSVVVRSSAIDTTLLSIAIFDNLEFSDAPNPSPMNRVHLSSTCHASILNHPCNVWSTSWHRFAEESELRLILLNMIR